MHKLTTFILATAFSAAAAAQTGSATLSWQAPTHNTNGTPLTDLVGYRVYASRTSPPTISVADITHPATLTHTVNGLAEGTWYFGVKARNSYGVESAMSNIATKEIPGSTPVPNPPTGLVVVSVTAYETRTTKGGLLSLWREAGTIPLGTACDSAIRIAPDYYAVPRDAVTPIRRRELSAVVVARCSS